MRDPVFAAILPMVINANLTLEGLYLADRLFVAPVPLESYVDLLGQPTTISGPPAPYGHRNNQIHVYNIFGLYLNENHATGRITEVTFVLDEARSTFSASRPFQGKLEVGGILFYPGMLEREYPAGAPIVFQNVLPGKHKAESGDIAIYLTASKKKDSTRPRPAKHRSFIEISIGFGVQNR